MTVHTRVTDSLPLPLRIDRASNEAPTLLLGGADWSLAATCIWRWVSAAGDVVTSESAAGSDAVWDLVGDAIIAVSWSGPEFMGLDPVFRLASGGLLDIMSDAAFDTWVLRLPEVTLVGPLQGGNTPSA